MKTLKKIEQQKLSKPKVKLKMRVSNAGTQTVNSDFKVKIQTRALNTYSRRQSSSLLQRRVRFYTGLPGFDVPFC